MASSVHTYGPTCLHSASNEDLSAWKSSPTPPRVRAQFFYTSSLPIDDPLSPLPPLSSTSSSGAKFPPQPFSARDNIALEEAWSGLRDAREARLTRRGNSREKTARIPVRGHEPGSKPGTPQKRQSLDDESLQRTPAHSPRFSTFLADEQGRQSPRFQEYSAQEASGSRETFAHGSLERKHIRSRQESGTNGGEEDREAGSRKREESPYGRRTKLAKRKSTSSPGREAAFEETEATSPRGTSSMGMSTSGSPFIRAPLRRSETPSEPLSEFGSIRDPAHFPRPESSQEAQPRPSESRSESTKLAESPDRLLDKLEEDIPQAVVPVGASRLHLVELPNLKV
ncbi:hypothetical protein VTN00DRAFT_3849 [Thermoascus crustaceus]|uniref:uncharacterized protein n=1 Tax=Thermoascus crustaceus TaxID=5088 RepID=UPI0037446B65